MRSKVWATSNDSEVDRGMGLAQSLRSRRICQIRFALPLLLSARTQNVIPEQDQPFGASRRRDFTAVLTLLTEFSGITVIIAGGTSVHRHSLSPTG